MNTTKAEFLNTMDIRPLSDESAVQCIFQDSKHLKQFSDAIGIPSISNLYVNVPLAQYNALRQLLPDFELRKGRDPEKPLWQCVFSEDEAAQNYKVVLEQLKIKLIKPDLKDTYPKGHWLSESQEIFVHNKQYFIRIDDVSKQKLDIFWKYCPKLYAMEHLKDMETFCGQLLTQFQAQILLPASQLNIGKKLQKISQDPWMSWHMKIEKINEAVNQDRLPGFFSFFTSPENEQFHRAYNQFNLKYHAQMGISAILVEQPMATNRAQLQETMFLQTDLIRNLQAENAMLRTQNGHLYNTVKQQEGTIQHQFFMMTNMVPQESTYAPPSVQPDPYQPF